MPNLFSGTITGAVTGGVTTPLQFNRGTPRNLTLQANFTYGAAGTTVDAWVQTTVDGGKTWQDIANFHFTTASARVLANLSSMTPITNTISGSDGSLSANTFQDGLIGSQLRVKYTTTGTYSGGTTLSVDAVTGPMQP